MWGKWMPRPGGKESAPAAEPEARGRKINDAVRLLQDTETEPDVELVFIHGLKVKDDEDMFWTTWLTLDNRICWPVTWLKGADFPVAARVLSLKYDSSAKKTATEGRFDLISAGESLLQQLYLGDAKVGQNNCPVVFVGHSLGGIVAEKIAITARERPNDEKAQNLLRNLKGFFFFATPHSGAKLFEKVWNVRSSERGPLLEALRELNIETTRLNDHFCYLKDNSYGDWRFRIAAESSQTTLNGVTVEPVSYASAKYLGFGDIVEIPGADHFTVCKPSEKSSTSFQLFKEFVLGIHNCKDFPRGGQLT